MVCEYEKYKMNVRKRWVVDCTNYVRWAQIVYTALLLLNIQNRICKSTALCQNVITGAFGVQLHKRRNDTQSWAHKVWTRVLESYSTSQRWALALKFVCFFLYWSSFYRTQMYTNVRSIEYWQQTNIYMRRNGIRKYSVTNKALAQIYFHSFYSEVVTTRLTCSI